MKVLVTMAVLHAAPAAGATCESLARLSLPTTTISAAQSIAAGPFRLSNGMTVQLPAYCRVHAVARPTTASEIHFELWLPVENWNGKYIQIGQSGFAGNLNSNGLAMMIQRGYAATYTDGGHQNDSSGGARGQWALGQPERIVDFAYRAMKEATDTSKALIRAFYERAPQWSYFAGCSDGGREAMKAAQRYPEDFNGILVGAPANDWSHHFAGFIWDMQALYKSPASAIPASKLPMIQTAVHAACDAQDGVKDGVVDDPRQCRFEPSSLLCKGTDGGECLTAPQVAALDKIRSGPKNPRTGKQIFPGYPLTSIANGEWAGWFLFRPNGGRPTQLTFAEQFFRNFVFDDLRYDVMTFDFDNDMATADNKPVAGERLADVINSYNPDLARFRTRGGKLLHYHGWEDQGIAAEVSTNYYEQVVAAQRAGNEDEAAALRKTQEFYRLFMVPGMQHCGGGPSPHYFGQLRQANPMVTPKPGPDYDMFAALERWVEQGVAPDKIIATKYVDDDPGRPVERTRPLCPYPQVARYGGSGSTDDATKFSCIVPK